MDIDWKTVPDFIAKYNEANPDSIIVNDDYQGSEMETLAKLAAILAHENVHLTDLEENDETTEADAYFQGVKTYMSILEALDMEGDTSFLTAMIAELGKAENYGANEGDDHYMILRALTNGEFQNGDWPTSWNTILGEGLSVEEVKALNDENKEASWNAYFEKEFLASGLNESERENFNPEMLEEDFKKELGDSKSTLAADYGYKKVSPENLYRVACKMYTAMYMAEVLTGIIMNGVDVNEKLTDNDIFADGNMLYTEEYMKAIELLADNKFDVTLERTQENALSFQQIMELQNSNDMYFIHIRYEGHSELVSQFELEAVYAQYGSVKSVETVNPWIWIDGMQSERSKLLAQTVLNPQDIERWDVFKVTPIDDPLANYYHNLLQ